MKSLSLAAIIAVAVLASLLAAGAPAQNPAPDPTQNLAPPAGHEDAQRERKFYRKGAAVRMDEVRVEIFKKKDGRYALIDPGQEPLRARDEIKIECEVRNLAGHLYLLNQEPGHLRLLFPAAGQSSRIEARRHYQLGEFEYEPEAGAEVLWAVFSRQPIKWLEQAAGRADDLLDEKAAQSTVQLLASVVSAPAARPALNDLLAQSSWAVRVPDETMGARDRDITTADPKSKRKSRVKARPAAPPANPSPLIEKDAAKDAAKESGDGVVNPAEVGVLEIRFKHR